MSERRSDDSDAGRLPGAGQTMPELLVVLSALAIVLLLPTVPLLRGLDAVGARSRGQDCQSAVALAQIRAIFLGRAVSVVGDPSLIEVADELGKLTLATAPSGLPLSTNLTRWRVPTGFTVTFGPGSASPNGAGSVFFGDAGWGSRVIIRPESGVTRRERQ